jgi:hypothetical protein
METVKIEELKIGDCVQLFNAAYGTASVYKIDEGVVFMFRPYAHLSDCVYSGNEAICYTGHEIIKFSFKYSQHLEFKKISR